MRPNAYAGTLNSRAYEPAPFNLKCIADRFQVVLQCLYSQCQTTQFGFALHQTLSACSDSEMGTLDAWPPLVGHKGFRKRGSASSGYASAHLSASAIHSVARRSVSASAYVSARPTRSAGQVATHTHDLPKSLPMAVSAPSSGAKMNDPLTKTS